MKKALIATLVLSALTFAASAQHNVVSSTDDFKVTGAVKNELHLSLRDLMQFKQDSLGDVVIKNKEGKDKEQAKGLKGVLLKTLLDSVHIYANKPKEYSELCISLIASDDYRNVYSWNELYNTEVGQHVYIITEMDGKPIDQMSQRILVMSLSDLNSGRRHLKGLSRIEVKKVQ
jgi:hypothetical protein